mmetsp:Transcript_32726/g.83039  ORF Transcript_32726/g.83039 Transcript_32726/m.83039 type:complete len:252 (-) Transcript_32726:272-1027(-)|eukprot:CAMPEP_0183442958 /NCGR_PEP_ID=MMETSP0370-20130417/90079_1 /TAXON_ID=268820 /ORGANISM="Peridinium aciculiferum, Strain PAER-2" /LENGTH=251 /DNA_ID=CAMNT_0025632777 /DNA_START=28 /DNA_END=783 /DNA_ORIENTATION=+
MSGYPVTAFSGRPPLQVGMLDCSTVPLLVMVLSFMLVTISVLRQALESKVGDLPRRLGVSRSVFAPLLLWLRGVGVAAEDGTADDEHGKMQPRKRRRNRSKEPKPSGAQPEPEPADDVHEIHAEDAEAVPDIEANSLPLLEVGCRTAEDVLSEATAEDDSCKYLTASASASDASEAVDEGLRAEPADVSDGHVCTCDEDEWGCARHMVYSPGLLLAHHVISKRVSLGAPGLEPCRKVPQPSDFLPTLGVRP